MIGVENGAEGYRAAWCLDLPGCYALVPPGTDLAERAALGIVEFTAWAHQRAAERITIEPSQVQIVQTVDSGSDLRGGDTTAFFVRDAEAASPREFPLWANPHDRALDEFRELALSIPPALLDHRLDLEGRTPLGILEHVTGAERYFARQLRPEAAAGGRPHETPVRDLQDAHMWLQQVVCDVPASLRVRREEAGANPEEWSVRKVMRRSIWHLRYHTWELRRAIGSIWLS